MLTVRRTMATLLHHYEGALVGALVGDCLGAPFEFSLGKDHDKAMNRITKFFKKVDEGKKKGKCEYTDDTAMLRSVANSLVEHKMLDARDLSKRFTEEFFREPGRGYGGSVSAIFKQLRDTEFSDPFGPAARHFDGMGSYGNGGAMRIAPAALFGLHFNEIDFNGLVRDITRVTHSHKDAINGAILECAAVQIALRSNLSDKPFTADQMVTELLDRMQRLEDTESSDERPYCAKLVKMQEILQQPSPPDVHAIVNEFGNDVSALHSVPSAVFSFLLNVDRASEGSEEAFNPFERTIIYAISLGGDTDTIASMAGAIAGAYYGINSIPKAWQEACEKLDEAKEQASRLYQAAEENRTKATSANL